MIKIIDGDLISNKPIRKNCGLIVKGKISAPGIKCHGLRAQEIVSQGDIFSDLPIDCEGDIIASGHIRCGSQIYAGGNIISKQFIISDGPIHASGNVIVAESLRTGNGITGKFIVAGSIEAKSDIYADFGIFSLGEIWSSGVIQGKMFIVSLSRIASIMISDGNFSPISAGWDVSGWGKIVSKYVMGLAKEELWRYVAIGA